jgi:hypothetical protein
MNVATITQRHPYARPLPVVIGSDWRGNRKLGVEDYELILGCLDDDGKRMLLNAEELMTIDAHEDIDRAGDAVRGCEPAGVKSNPPFVIDLL